MKCQDFEGLWNERLDARGLSSPDLERALDGHAAACPACRDLAARYRLLGQALSGLSPVTPPECFAERCIAAAERPPITSPLVLRLTRVWPIALPLAAAAGLLVAVLLGLWVGGQQGGPKVVTLPRHDSELLPEALADVTSATWELALEASAPAARIGRDALDVAVEDATTELTPPSRTAAETASDVLHTVGERVNEGVKPLSGSARHAFGFLLGPALDEGKDTPRPS